MRPRDMAGLIAASVRASLNQVIERGQSLEQALELGIDKAIGNNAAQAIALSDENDQAEAAADLEERRRFGWSVRQQMEER